jgi:phosphatidate cytidylyltransferase
MPELAGPFLLFAVLATLSWGLATTRQVEATFSSVSGNLFALCYLGLPFSLISTYHQASYRSAEDSGRPFELVFVLLVVWVSDAAALFVGRVIGRHKITPVISPNKTMEGYAAALAVPVLLAAVAGDYLLPGHSLLLLSTLAFLIAAAGTLGDLFESILKRGAKIKDTSNLIPGHGGVLDRIDSLLFAVPAYYLTMQLMA